MDKSIRNSNWYKEHQKWLKDSKGKRADLFGEDLYGADLRDADLHNADLRDANLRDANLRGANLYGADLCGANLYGANLRGADLCSANLYNSDLRGANLFGANLYNSDLRGANLFGANLRGADLCGANLYGANLRGVDLCSAIFNFITIGLHPAPEGDLIVWGKKSNHIVKMLVKAQWKRSCATTRKFRSEAVLVLEIDDGEIDRIVHSRFGSDETIYKVGAVTRSDSWDENRWNECSNGIHWFLTCKEAEEWTG
jgi:hypothetical protein